MWKIKILIQFLLSKIPNGESINHLLQRLNKSFSEEQISVNIREHLRIIKKIHEHLPLEDIVVVEIGTGWIPIFPVFLYLAGVKICHSFDHKPHVRFSLINIFFRCIDNQLEDISEAISVPIDVLRFRLTKLRNCPDLDTFFNMARTYYHAPGNASRTDLENGSVDLIVSNAVLEHVPKKTVFDLTMESRRILRTTGIAYHFIGLHDHYASLSNKLSNVNFIKYSESLWSFFVLNDISYHNRLREKQYLDIFQKCGATIVWLKNKTDPRDMDALKRMNIDKSFQGMSFEELAIHQSEIILSFFNKCNAAVTIPVF